MPVPPRQRPPPGRGLLPSHQAQCEPCLALNDLAAPSAPIPNFARGCGPLSCELRNQRNTGKLMIPVRFSRSVRKLGELTPDARIAVRRPDTTAFQAHLGSRFTLCQLGERGEGALIRRAILRRLEDHAG